MTQYNATNPLPDLKPCPFCGSGNVFLMEGMRTDSYVLCDDCDCRSGSDRTTAAITLWNTRPGRTAENAVVSAPNPSLTFSEALEAMKHRKVVQRGLMQFRLDVVTLQFRPIGRHYWTDCPTRPFYSDDLVATDWQVMEVEEPTPEQLREAFEAHPANEGATAMSPEQIAKLVELEPDRFALAHSFLMFRHPYRNAWWKVDQNPGEVCWWMLQTMRARFDELYKKIQEGGYNTCTTDGPWNDSEYMALDAFMGTEATSLDEDTVINAYINWKEQAQ